MNKPGVLHKRDINFIYWFLHKPARCLHIYLRTLKTHHHIFALFLLTFNAIEKLLAGFNVQPRIGMNQSLI